MSTFGQEIKSREEIFVGLNTAGERLPSVLERDIKVIKTKNGLVVVKPEILSADGKNKMDVFSLNEDLAQFWNTSVDFDGMPVDYLEHEGDLYVLIQKPDFKNVTVYHFNVLSGDFTTINHELKIPLENLSFKVIHSSLVFLGKQDGKSSAEILNMNTNISRLISAGINEQNIYHEITVNSLKSEFYITTSRKSNCSSQVFIYDLQGNFKNRIILGDKNRKVYQAKIICDNDGEAYVLGTYNLSCVPVADGIYFKSLLKSTDNAYIRLRDLGANSFRSRKEQLRVYPIAIEDGEVTFSAEVFKEEVGGVLRLDKHEMIHSRATPYHFAISIDQVFYGTVNINGDYATTKQMNIRSGRVSNSQQQAIFLNEKEDLVSLLPSKNYLNYKFSNRERNLQMVIIQNEKYDISSVNSQLLKGAENSFFAHGTAYIRDLTKVTENYQKIFFIKKFSLEQTL